MGGIGGTGSDGSPGVGGVGIDMLIAGTPANGGPMGGIGGTGSDGSPGVGGVGIDMSIAGYEQSLTGSPGRWCSVETRCPPAVERPRQD
jgi:hypothetical protein